MSAYMVSKAHIDAMVWLATRPRARCSGLEDMPSYTHEGPMTPDEIENEIGTRLIAENRASIGHRYPDTVGHPEREPGPVAGMDPVYTFTPLRRFPTVIEGIKIVQCYEYQACEHPGWVGSWSQKLCERLTSTLIGELPGYDAAPWGWDGEPEPGHGPVISLSDLARRRR